MRYGQSLFGAAVTGLVLAAGTAICSASATGRNEVTRLGAGTAAVASTLQGTCHRDATGKGALAQAKALVSGAAQVEFHPLPVEIHCTATVTGRAQVDFSGYGQALANGQVIGKAVRRVRMFPRQARAYAYGEASADTWQMAFGAPARATAWAFGTTHHVGGGRAQGLASASAKAVYERAAKGLALATAQGEATVLYTGGVSGTAPATAHLAGDAAVTRQGVRYFEGVGVAQATAHAQLQTVVLFQQQQAFARCTAAAAAKVSLGGKGVAKARANAYGDALTMITGVTGVVGATAATAIGKAVYLAHGKGTAVAKASATGSALVKQTKTYGKTAQAKAVAQGQPRKQAAAKSQAVATATAQGRVLRTVMAKGIARPLATAKVTRLAIAVRGVVAAASASVQGTCLYTATAHPQAAMAIATATGFNQINDLTRAPISRTVFVEQHIRIIEVEQQLRLITV